MCLISPTSAYVIYIPQRYCIDHSTLCNSLGDQITNPPSRSAFQPAGTNYCRLIVSSNVKAFNMWCYV